MRWLTRRIRHQHPERGALAALVAILLTCGVLTGMGAVVIDGGQLYAARAQVQSGADAAALSLAAACARTPVGASCPFMSGTTSAGVASSYATGNSGQGGSHTTAVCGSSSATGATAIACPTHTGNPLICPTTPAAGTNYVEVHTQTGASSSSRLLPPVFGRAVMGPSYNGKAVEACAQAAWGGIGSAAGASITFSKCAWNAATTSGTVFASPPPYGTSNPWPPGPAYPKSAYDPTTPGLPGGEQVLALHGSGNDCAGNLGSGWNYPGGFGWLVDDNNLCQTSVNVNNTYPGTTGNAANSECEAIFDASRTNESIIFLPIFDGFTGTGNNGTYHLAGFAAFILTGGFVKGHGNPWNQPSSVSGKSYCKDPDICLYGYFTQALIPADALPGGSNFGATVVSLTG